ncbi:MAG: LCP family protein [Clostridia bacterium]|nr:LCP family protein [Clostridia bacterium]
MKKNVFLWTVFLLLVLACSGLTDGISVKARDIEASKTRDKAVTNILIMLQEEDKTLMMAVASFNTATGKAVMTSLSPSLMVEIPETGSEVPLSDVYALGDRKSKGLLAVRTVNRLLDLNIGMYMAMDMSMIPSLVETVESTWITPTVEEDRELGLEEDTWALDGEQTLAYMKLKLPEDEPEKNRSYEVMIQLLRQAAEQDFMSMMGVGKTLLSSMDTNVGIMSAVSLGSSLKGGAHHTDLFLPQAEAVLEQNPLHADAALMQQLLTEVVYE